MKSSARPRTRCFLGCVIAFGLTACGSSVYSSAARDDSAAARKEDAIIALNGSDYEKASDTLARLWQEGRTNELAQLYGIALLGRAGIDLFEQVTNALAEAGKSGQKKEGSAGNKILDTISAILPDMTDAQLAFVRSAITVLQAAPDQTNAGLKFQKCLTAGIYAAPTLSGITTSVASLQATLDALPGKLQSSGTTCGASAATIAEVGAELNAAIAAAGRLSQRLADVSSVVGECLPGGSGEKVNEITSKVSRLTANADKGCGVPVNQQLGRFTLPTCMNAFVASSGSGTAGNGVVEGCELFVNCSNGSCF